MTAREAAALLDVKLPTLYAYVSRGLVRSIAGPKGRPRRYLRADVDRLVARRDARKGHGAVAAGALRWGEPVLDSAITEIAPAGHRYRGASAVELATSGQRFEQVAELLWTGALPDRADWPAPGGRLPRTVRQALPTAASPVERMSIAVPILAAADPDRHAAAAVGDDLDRARRLIGTLARVAAAKPGAIRAGDRLALTLARGFGARPLSRSADAIDAALVLIADHELNVSSFAARVVASAGADLYAAVTAALAALSGPLHGGACDRVEALLDACSGRAEEELRERAARGEAIPGFGHRLYPDGDPRCPPLFEHARAIAGQRSRPARQLSTIDAAIRAMARAGARPAVDLALVALTRAAGMPAGSATALFAIGRAAGWVAHAREQRSAGFMLRPRARFVGVAESSGERNRREPGAAGVAKGNATKTREK